MSKSFTVLAVLAGAMGLANPVGLVGQNCPAAERPTRESEGALAHVRYLADDALEGREVGSRGARCAAEYIASRFEALGLEGAGPNESFFQSFSVRAGSTLGARNDLRLDEASYPVQTDWIPFGYTASDVVTTSLIYGGDGINRPNEPNNTYPTLALEHHIVVVEDGDLAGGSDQALQADPHFKASVAAGRGAFGIIVLLGRDRELPDLVNETRAALRIPVAAVRGAAADRIREAARAGATATLETSVEPRAAEARNVVALLTGSDPRLADEVLIVGAHYDHLGLGGDGSLDPDAIDVVHNGADDNASGTAALIEVAQRLSQGDRRPARSVLFMAFTGEEKGLWGSAHYVRNPLVPIARSTAMLNMDMVGRLEGRTLTVMGVGTAEEWIGVLDRSNRALERPLKIATAPDGFGPSDHSSFYGEGIPVLHFFSNTHEDYHRPSDDFDKIDGDGLESILELVTEVAVAVAGDAGSSDRIALTPVEAVATPAHGETSSSSSGGYGPYLGSIPDMVPTDFGLRLSGVREGSPAQEGGLQKGDVVVEFGGKEVGDIYAYTYALREHAPGDEVDIVVVRDGERVTLTVTLGDRR